MKLFTASFTLRALWIGAAVTIYLQLLQKDTSDQFTGVCRFHDIPRLLGRKGDIGGSIMDRGWHVHEPSTTRVLDLRVIQRRYR